MATTTVQMGAARVIVPEGATVHEIEAPPDDIAAMQVIRVEVVPGAAAMIVLAARRWQAAWRMPKILDGFADGCDPASVTIEDVRVPGAVVAHRVSGTTVGRDDDDRVLEAVTTVVGRTGDGMLYSMTLRMEHGDQRATHVANAAVLDSFAMDGPSF